MEEHYAIYNAEFFWNDFPREQKTRILALVSIKIEIFCLADCTLIIGKIGTFMQFFLPNRQDQPLFNQEGGRLLLTLSLL